MAKKRRFIKQPTAKTPSTLKHTTNSKQTNDKAKKRRANAKKAKEKRLKKIRKQTRKQQNKLKQQRKKQHDKEQQTAMVLLTKEETNTQQDRLSAFQDMVAEIPRNNNFLSYLLDINQFPHDFHTLEHNQLKHYKELAKIPINMTQGFCCLTRKHKQSSTEVISSGIDPLWNKLYFEDDNSYELFEFYRTSDTKDLETVYYFSQQNFFNIPKHKILELYVFHFWEERLNSYNIQRVAANANVNSLRQLDVKNFMYRSCVSKMEGIDAELARRAAMSDGVQFGDVTTATLIKLSIELGTAARVAVDLPRYGKTDTQSIEVNTNIKQTMQKANLSHNGESTDKDKDKEQAQLNLLNLKSKLAENPEEWEQIQEIALKLQQKEERIYTKEE